MTRVERSGSFVDSAGPFVEVVKEAFGSSFGEYLRGVFGISVAASLLGLVGVRGYIGNVDKIGTGVKNVESPYRNICVLPVNLGDYEEYYVEPHRASSSGRVFSTTMHVCPWWPSSE